jgi:Septum formation
VNDRWVCKRCFADNESTDSACQRCGLIRGADATEADQTGWAQAASTAPPQPAGWQRWLRYWWIPVLVVVLAGGYLFSARRGDDGSLATAGTLNVDDLRAGDCFNSGADVEITDVDGVPCNQAHEYEVFAVGTWEGDGTFPPDSQLEAIFFEVCEPSFASYVGEPYATSAIYGDMITPSEESWSAGDREVICLLYDPEEAQLTESLRGAAR